MAASFCRNCRGTVTVCITDHAQDQLGDLVYVETPEVGASFGAEEIPRNEFHTRLNYALSTNADFNALPQSAPPEDIVAIIRDNCREPQVEDDE